MQSRGQLHWDRNKNGQARATLKGSSYQVLPLGHGEIRSTPRNDRTGAGLAVGAHQRAYAETGRLKRGGWTSLHCFKAWKGLNFRDTQVSTGAYLRDSRQCFKRKGNSFKAVPSA